VSVTAERGTEERPTALPAAVDLVVTGMTCSSCSARIAIRLNRLDGVKAMVNYAGAGPAPAG
jgi:Cu+-exporting ATPase